MSFDDGSQELFSQAVVVMGAKRDEGTHADARYLEADIKRLLEEHDVKAQEAARRGRLHD